MPTTQEKNGSEIDITSFVQMRWTPWCPHLSLALAGNLQGLDTWPVGQGLFGGIFCPEFPVHMSGGQGRPLGSPACEDTQDQAGRGASPIPQDMKG